MRTNLSIYAILCVLLLTPSAFAETVIDRTFTMESAIEKVLNDNPVLAASKKNVDMSETSFKSSISNFGPSINTQYIYTYSPEDSPLPSEDMFTWAIVASQPLFTGFNLLNTTQKAYLEMEYQRLSHEQTTIGMVNAVQTLFLSYLMADESVRSSERSIERAAEQLETAQALYTLGLRPKLDVLQAQMDMSATEATLIENENIRETVRANLNAMLNLPIDESANYIGTFEEVPFGMTLQECLEKAFIQRPDLQMALTSVEKARKDLGIVASSFSPQIEANLQWTTSGTDWKVNGGFPPGAPDHQDLKIGATLSWNIFSTGKRYFGVRQANSGIDALEYLAEDTFNTVAYDVKAGYLKLHDAQRTMDVAARLFSSAQQTYEEAKLRYELQLATNLEMLTAQSDLAEAELIVISSKAGYLIALSNLYKAIGEFKPDLLQN